MLVPYLFRLELFFILLVVDLLENVLEPAVVFLKNGVFGCEIEWVLPLQGKVEAAMSETLDAFVGIVHPHSHSSCALVMVDFHFLLSTVITFEGDLELAWFVDHKICGLVLVSESMAADNDGLLPSGDEPRDILDDNGLPENGAIENVPNGAVGTLPHLFELELGDSGLIGGDGGTFDAHLALLDGVGSIDGHLVVGGVPVLNA